MRGCLVCSSVLCPLAIRLLTCKNHALCLNHNIPLVIDKIMRCCDTMNKLSPSSSSNEGGEVAAGKLLKSGSVRVDDTVNYNVLSSG